MAQMEPNMASGGPQGRACQRGRESCEGKSPTVDVNLRPYDSFPVSADSTDGRYRHECGGVQYIYNIPHEIKLYGE